MTMMMTRTTITIWMIWLIYYDVCFEDQRKISGFCDLSIRVVIYINLDIDLKQCGSLFMLQLLPKTKILIDALD